MDRTVQGITAWKKTRIMIRTAGGLTPSAWEGLQAAAGRVSLGPEPAPVRMETLLSTESNPIYTPPGGPPQNLPVSKDIYPRMGEANIFQRAGPGKNPGAQPLPLAAGRNPAGTPGAANRHGWTRHRHLGG